MVPNSILAHTQAPDVSWLVYILKHSFPRFQGVGASLLRIRYVVAITASFCTQGTRSNHKGWFETYSLIALSPPHAHTQSPSIHHSKPKLVETRPCSPMWSGTVSLYCIKRLDSFKLTWLVLGKDLASCSCRVEQFIAH